MVKPVTKFESSQLKDWAVLFFVLGIYRFEFVFITTMSDVVLLPQGCEFLPVKQPFKLLKTCVFVLEGNRFRLVTVI